MLRSTLGVLVVVLGPPICVVAQNLELPAPAFSQSIDVQIAQLEIQAKMETLKELIGVLDGRRALATKEEERIQ